jgi:hypothetical protein
VIHADAMRIDGVPGPPPTALVANLPYNVSVPVLLHLLTVLPSLEKGLVMVQSEVADRLAAPPGSRTYGVPSVKAAWFADVRRSGSVGRNVFWPAPNVDSGLVAWSRRERLRQPPGEHHVDLDGHHPVGHVEQGERQRTEPGAHLDHDVVGTDPGLPDDAAHGVAVDHEVLAALLGRPQVELGRDAAYVGRAEESHAARGHAGQVSREGVSHRWSFHAQPPHADPSETVARPR